MNCNSDFSLIPYELKQEIFSFVRDDIPSFLRIGATCRNWQILSLDPLFLERIFDRNFPEAVAAYRRNRDRQALFYSLFMEGRLSSKSFSPEEKNLGTPLKKNLGTVLTVINCFERYKNVLFVASNYGLMIYEMDDTQNFETITSSPIYSLRMVNSKLYIGEGEGIIEIWDRETGILEKCELPYKTSVLQIETIKNKIFLSLKDEILISEGSQFVEFKKNLKGPFCLSNEYFISTDKYNNICIFDLEGNEKKKFKADFAVTHIFESGEKLIVGGAYRGVIKVFDLAGQELAHIQTGRFFSIKVSCHKIFINKGMELQILNFEGEIIRKISVPSYANENDFFEGRWFVETGVDVTLYDFNLPSKIRN